MSDDTRTCIRCAKDKPASEFRRDKAGEYYPACRRCHDQALTNESKRRLRAADPNRIRRDNLWQKYKITPAEYDALRVAQGHRCAICKRHESELDVKRVGGRPRRDGSPAAQGMVLHVDHDHGTSRVRGLLCTGCNQAIGLMDEDPARLELAARYVREQSRASAA